MDEDRNAPATKGDLADGLANLRDELLEAIRDSQTGMLRAFYGFTQTIQAQFTEHDQADAAIKQRLSIVESRVLEIEKRLNIPPSAV